MEDNNILSNNNSKFSNAEVMQFINNDDPIDLLEIQANKLLKDIKRIIGIELDSTKEQKIDSNFILSLKKMIIINNNQISDEYLNELSFVYFAQYNNTIDIYYKLKGLYDKIYYFMLDENLYNNIIDTKKDDWTQYSEDQLGTLETAYKNGIYNELISILRINPTIAFGDVNINILLKKETFLDLINTFGKEVIAYSNILYLLAANDEKYREFSKKLVSANPNIKIQDENIFNKLVKKVFTEEQIAFFTSENFKSINLIFAKYNGEETCLELLKYYSYLILWKHDYLIDKDECELLYYFVYHVYMSPKQYATLTDDERQNLIDLHKRYNSYWFDESPSMIDRHRLNKGIKKLIKQYDELN